MLSYALTFAGGVAVGIIVEKIVSAIKNNGGDKAKALEECFGEPMHTDKFTVSEAKEWISARQDLLDQDTKAVIMKINSDTLKSIGKDIQIGSTIKDTLLVAIVDTVNNEVKDAVLIKYQMLDTQLEQLLSKGNGVLVVEA